MRCIQVKGLDHGVRSKKVCSNLLGTFPPSCHHAMDLESKYSLRLYFGLDILHNCTKTRLLGLGFVKEGCDSLVYLNCSLEKLIAFDFRRFWATLPQVWIRWNLLVIAHKLANPEAQTIPSWNFEVPTFEPRASGSTWRAPSWPNKGVASHFQSKIWLNDNSRIKNRSVVKRL